MTDLEIAVAPTIREHAELARTVAVLERDSSYTAASIARVEKMVETQGDQIKALLHAIGEVAKQTQRVEPEPKRSWVMSIPVIGWRYIGAGFAIALVALGFLFARMLPGVTTHEIIRQVQQ